MLRFCQICGKGIEIGHNVSYSKRRTRRVFLPNLRLTKISLGGKVQKVRICMKCLKKAKNEGRVVMGKVPSSKYKVASIKKPENIEPIAEAEERNETNEAEKENLASQEVVLRDKKTSKKRKSSERKLKQSEPRV